MDSAHWEKLKELFSEAIDLPAAERVKFVENCDEDLRDQIKNLIEAHEHAGGFIAEPAMVEIGLADDTDANIGRRIDGYEILSEIGQGGMGAVYLAKHSDESFSQNVAVKLIKRGMDTAAVLKRFVMERQILANLEHQNIARLLDVGTTEDGLPYFVMEYIEGLPITKFCDAHEFSVEERLKLFRQICAAVQYAHQNLVVHRDIKPSNILVTKDETPKLLDFGIAKLLNPDWSVETAEATATMMRLLTPEYASPEQLRGANVTTASDVYSLGVVLYELLSGRRPFVIESESREEFIQAILTKEPIRPSSVVYRPLPVEQSETAEHKKQLTTDDGQRTNPKSQIPNPKSLKGDLDNIILKALRKEPERRYASVQEFSEDIRRHLAGLPVSATADTAAYRFRKFIKRHRVGVLAGFLVAFILLAATAITSWQAVAAERERDRAEQRFRQVRQMANSFMFEFHDSIKDLPGSTAARELVTKKALEYLDNLAGEQTEDASLRYELAVAYKKVGAIQERAQSANTGDTKGAFESYRKAAEILEALRLTDSASALYRRELADVYTEISAINQITGDFAAAHENNARALRLLEEQIAADPTDVTSKISLGHCYKATGDMTASKGEIEKSLESYRKVLETSEAALKIEPENRYAKEMLMTAYDAIGTTLGNPNYTNLGDTAGALNIYRKQLELSVQMLALDTDNLPAQHRKAYTLKVIGEVLTATGDWKSALANYEQSAAIYQKLVQFDQKDAYTNAIYAYLLTNIGEAHSESGDTTKALEYHRQAIERLVKVTGEDRDNSSYLTYLARAYQRNGDALLKANRIESAIEFYQKALTNDEQMASEDTENMDIRLALAEDYAKIGRANFLLATNAASGKNELLQSARKRFEQSRAVYIDMQAHNLKTNPIKDSIDKLNAEIVNCASQPQTRWAQAIKK